MDSSKHSGRRAATHSANGEDELIDAGFRYAFSLTHHLHDAEDVVQQACLRIYRRKGTLTNKAYLFVTIRNIFRDAQRRRSLMSFEGLTNDPQVSKGNGDAQTIEAKIDVESILASLDQHQRELLYLHNIEGFTAKEISRITKQPRGTVLSQLSRVKKKLAERFSKEKAAENITR